MKVKNPAYYVIANKLYFLWFGYILNPFWRGRKRFRDVRRDVNVARIRRICRSFWSVLDNVPEPKIVKDDENEKIFTIWQQGEKNAPPLIQACFRSIRKNCKQELVVLDDDNIFDYITLPDVIVEKYKRGIIGRAHFADICRVELLYQYGGFWFDATGFATGAVPQWLIDLDFFMYNAGQYTCIQNCFIRARKGSYLLGAWRELILNWWENYSVMYGYFTHQLIFRVLVEDDPRARKYFNQMPCLPAELICTLWYVNGNKPFTQQLFDECANGAFFQKTTYKSPHAQNQIPGSVADVMINEMFKD